MKVKFKNGYTVEVTDAEGMSKNQIYKEALAAMKATKKYKDAKNVNEAEQFVIKFDMGPRRVTETYTTKEKAEARYKELLELQKKPSMTGMKIYRMYDAVNPDKLIEQLEDCIRLFKKGPEYYYDAVDELNNAVKTAKTLFPSVRFEDSNPSITYKPNMLSHISKVKAAIDKKTGEVIDPEMLDYEIRNIEIDMDADLAHENWHKKYMPEALKAIIDDYEKYLEVLRTIKDEKYIAKVEELESKLDGIKKVFKMVDETEEVVEDAKCKDIPVAEPTASYSLNPDPYFSVDNIDDANAYLVSRDPQKKEAAVKMLKNEFPAIRKNMENDIDNAEEFIEKFNKDQLRIFMETYKNIIDVFNAAGLMAEYKTLADLYNELYYNALHLGRKMGREISGSRSVVARRGK